MYKHATINIIQHSGVTYAPTDKVTAQGYDIQFGTNVLGE
jgi:hypothetical protein